MATDDPDGGDGGGEGVGGVGGVEGSGLVGLVGLVAVSHSLPLAEAAVALSREMLHDRPVALEVAAGVDDGAGGSGFGTDAVRIKDAVERADGPAGVVVLMDLGSALLSSELALELLAPETRERVALVGAPFVEGLVVATVAAAGGATRDEVVAEARGALAAKTEQLGEEPDAVADGEPQEPDGPVETATFVVGNPHGLHARPAARLVSQVRGLGASVRLRNLTTGTGPVPADSLSRVATLAALAGHEVEVSATGPGAADVVAGVLALAADRFGEAEEVAVEPPAAAGPGALPGAPGIVVGPARRLEPVEVAVEEEPSGSPAQEWERLEQALAGVRRGLEGLRAGAAGDEAGIFEAHLSLLDDDDLLARVREAVDAGGAAPAAWTRVLAEVEQTWADLPDPYLRERAADVRAVSGQVLRALVGAPPARVSGPGVLVAADLTPAEAAGLDLDLVAGVLLAHGSPTSHAAILARARDLPLVVAAGPAVLEIAEGTTLVLDGTRGEVAVDPPAAVVAAAEQRAADAAADRERDRAAAHEPAVTVDDVTVLVEANLGSVADAEAARRLGADGSGLVRTELLFLDRDTAPGPEEQQATYAGIVEALGGRRVTLRTLDVGGDKPLPYLPAPREDNPFLGRRGVRLGLHTPDLLREQLRALCAAAAAGPVGVMVPMVATPSELVRVRELLDEVVGAAGPPPGLEVGMMVEVPAAALNLEAFLPHLDFVSIGTNDLTQYTMAAERGNEAVAALSDPLEPAVLRLVRRVCRVCREDGDRVRVGVCGEAAGDPAAVPLLVGLGVRELSTSAPAVPRVKALVRGLDATACAALAERALGAGDAAGVRRLVAEALPEVTP